MAATARPRPLTQTQCVEESRGRCHFPHRIRLRRRIAALTLGRARRNLRGMRSRFLPLLLVLSALPLAQVLYPGCATLVNGPTQKVNVKSDPVQATVFLNGKEFGQTPVTMSVSRWGFHRLRIEMRGYEPCEIPLEKEFNEMASVNLFLGIAPIVVDAVSGAIIRLNVPETSRKNVDRGRIGVSNPEFGCDALTITVGLKPVAGGTKIGQMQKR